MAAFELKICVLQIQSCGSFLSRNKHSLTKMAETTKVLSNPHLSRNSRNFVFSTISSLEHKEKVQKKSEVCFSLNSAFFEIVCFILSLYIQYVAEI